MMHNAWKNFSENIAKSSLEELSKNSSFNQTMFCSAFEKQEFNHLIQHFLLQEIEELVDEPVKTMTRANNIHQLYHLHRFIQFAGKEAFQENIVEFGAGYGSFCVRVNRLLKPKGYNIIELPILHKIQAEYLSVNNTTNVNWYDSFEDYLKFKKCSGVFIALWSLSETPQEVRDYIAANADFDYYLFAYGDSFFDVKNLEYFERFREERPYLKWYREKIPFIENQYYLMGKK